MTAPQPVRLPTAQAPDDEPISQEQVLARWACLSVERLRAARAAGHISWIKGKRGHPFYRPGAVKAYIADYLEHPCPAHGPIPSSNSADNGSPATQPRLTYIDFGVTEEMLEHVARVSARQI